ncbi:5-formyltetrahydrofolate cyclo-ligase [Reichenbachiella sp. MSK19-1]|nr:5-formyltetrahydrofolate cyclo-ligase [Reichenbachiella sp. MSK19-1]
MDKAKLRTVYLRKRKMLSAEMSAEIASKILCQFKVFLTQVTVRNVHVFLPITKQSEINTWLIIDHLISESIDTIISKSDLSTNQLTHYRYENKEQLQFNKWGIPEPTSGQIVLEDDIDMVIVPLITFDRRGHRIGYGKGYYDRFLSSCRPDCLKVGLSMSPPLDIIPYVDSYDVALDYCITPLKNYKF